MARLDGREDKQRERQRESSALRGLARHSVALSRAHSSTRADRAADSRRPPLEANRRVCARARSGLIAPSKSSIDLGRVYAVAFGRHLAHGGGVARRRGIGSVRPVTGAVTSPGARPIRITVSY